MATTQEQRFGQGVGFDRVRRITGYLVGTLNKWNNAKRAEERDRVKHSLTPTAAAAGKGGGDR